MQLQVDHAIAPLPIAVAHAVPVPNVKQAPHAALGPPAIIVPPHLPRFLGHYSEHVEGVYKATMDVVASLSKIPHNTPFLKTLGLEDTVAKNNYATKWLKARALDSEPNEYLETGAMVVGAVGGGAFGLGTSLLVVHKYLTDNSAWFKTLAVGASTLGTACTGAKFLMYYNRVNIVHHRTQTMKAIFETEQKRLTEACQRVKNQIPLAMGIEKLNLETLALFYERIITAIETIN